MNLSFLFIWKKKFKSTPSTADIVSEVKQELDKKFENIRSDAQEVSQTRNSQKKKSDLRQSARHVELEKEK